MTVSGDWVTPRLNGIKYFEKPPLQYWTTAAAYEAFGQHEWTARLWPALTGFAGLLLTLVVGTRLFGKDAAILATAMLAGSLIYVLMGHFNTLDMGLAFFMHLALSGFLMANQPGTPPAAIRRWMLITWAALALAVLSKGLVAPGPCRRNAAGLFAGDAGFLALAAAGVGARPAPFSADRSPLVRRRLARQSGVPPLLLHSRARRALPHQDPSPLPARLVFLRGLCRRRTALDRRDDPWPACAPPRRGAGVSHAMVPAGLGGADVCVFLALQFEAAVLYPAPVSGGGMAGRRGGARLFTPRAAAASDADGARRDGWASPCCRRSPITRMRQRLFP